MLTDHGREFYGTSAHPYELYLELHDIQHRRTKVLQPQTNGFVERFHRTVLLELLEAAPDLMGKIETEGVYQNGGWRLVRHGTVNFQGGRAMHECITVRLLPSNMRR